MNRFPWLGAVLIVALAGCSSESTTTAQFNQSPTPEAPGLVKLVQSGGGTGDRLVLDVLLFGPERTLDLFAFRFGVKIGNPTLVRFIRQSAYDQTALTAAAGQTIAIDVDGTSDPSLVQVTVEKLGGGAGNGVAAAAAEVIQLSFDAQGTGDTTLTLVGLGASPPQALDSSQAPIVAVSFDAVSARVTVETTGGSGY